MTLNDPGRACGEPASPPVAVPSGPTAYKFRVSGHLDDNWAAWFGTLAVTCESDGTSTLVVPVPDQSALHGLLGRIRDLGLTLISVEALDTPGNSSILRP